MKVKALIIGTALLASTVFGDYYNVLDRFVRPARYWSVRVDPECYQRPFQLEKRYKVNEKGDLEVYVGEGDRWYKVSKDLRVNERGLGEKLKDETKEVVPYIKKKVEDLVEWYKRSFEDGNPD